MLNCLERIEKWLWPAAPNSETAIRRKLRGLLRRAETLNQFHSRTGIGRYELAHVLTREEIAARIATAEANSKDEAAPPMFQPIVLFNHGHAPQPPHPQPKPPSNIELIGPDGDTGGVVYEKSDPSRQVFF